jgi:hypothetical protein
VRTVFDLTSNKGEHIMSVFDGDWHCYIESAGNPPVLELHGGLRLQVNPDNGELLDSSLGENAISGHVDETLRSIHIVEEDAELGRFTYIGRLVFVDIIGGDQTLVACGKFVLQNAQPVEPPPGNVAALEAQDEGTWVITKP